jgi:predicted dithiol-disulfide oxidoreductase (DUF899 family)
MQGVAMGVSFTPEQLETKKCEYNFTGTWNYGSEAPGVSVFRKRKRDGALFHRYSTYSAGLGELSLAHSILDLTSAGRDEADPKGNMWWVKHKEEYELA